MKFKAGDKVWVIVDERCFVHRDLPKGKFPGVVEGEDRTGYAKMCWHLPGYSISCPDLGGKGWVAREDVLEPRDDPKKEEMGRWEDVPGWKEITREKEVA